MDNNKEKKEERTESIWFQVTPSVKKELDAAIDNDELKETIIKNFIKSETNWLVEEMKEIDDITIQYKAKLVQIKSNFKEAQSAYVEEIEKLIDISTPILNKLNNQFNVLNIKLHGTKEEAYNLNPSPSYKGRKLKIYYVNQVDKAPPKFLFHVNNKTLLHFSYERYLENKLRESFELEGTPIVLQFKNRGE